MSVIPDFHCQPTERLKKPVSMQTPAVHTVDPMKPFDFYERVPESIRSDYTEVFDPTTGNASEEGPQFSGDFECGNIGQVFKIGERSYEIHLIPDPNDQQTTQWFFFKVANLEPGEYFFAIVGFYRSCNLHWRGSKCCVYSENDAAQRGIGWQRIGEDMNYFSWKKGRFPEWAWTFKFTVKETDTMYFAHAYPYTYTDMMKFLNKLPIAKTSILCKTVGDVDFPVVYWDADQQKSLDIQEVLANKPKDLVHRPPSERIEDINEHSEFLVNLLNKWREGVREPLPGKGTHYDKKPVIVITARTHPGETNSSFAMEKCMQRLFGDDEIGQKLRENFSFFLIPMVNPDGVICGFYRPSLSGDDMNRVWPKPDPVMHPETVAVLDVLATLRQDREIIFFLDFHGHTAACNSFVYGFMNENDPNLYSVEKAFPLLVTKHTNLFSYNQCSFLKQKCYEGTMRVVVRRRFLAVFAYTLEMSYGGSDFGPRKDTQFNPDDYREVGNATVEALYDLFLNEPGVAEKEALMVMPPPSFDTKKMQTTEADARIEKGVMQSQPVKFTFSVDDISTEPPKKVHLVLNQVFRDDKPAPNDDPTKIEMPYPPAASEEKSTEEED